MARFYSNYIEKWSAYLIAVAFSFTFYRYVNFDRVHIDALLYDKLVDFSGILFGFLITVLTILIQTNNSAIRVLKTHDRFNDLISLNKEVITVSAFVCAYTLAILALKDSLPLEYFSFFKKWGLTGLIFITVLMIIKTYTYLRIFYKVIKSKD